MNSRERTNIRALGLTHLLLGPVYLLGAVLLGRVVATEQPPDVGSIIGVCYLGCAGAALLLSGIGIMARKKWALPFMLVAGASQLPAVPVGTAIGAWTLAVHSRLAGRKQRRSHHPHGR